MTAAATNVYDLIREVIAELPEEASPREIAEATATRTPEENLVDFYAEALVPLVRSEMSTRRASAMKNVFNPPKHKRGRRMPNGTYSTKIAKEQDAWARMREERISVNGVWKRLGSCGVEDLDILIFTREEQIAADVRQNERYKRLRLLLQKYKADVLDDIPPTVAEQFLEEK